MDINDLIESSSNILKYSKPEDLKNDFGIIYKIINLINNKVYIGQTIRSLKERWKEHLIGAIKNKEHKYLYYAIMYFGIKNFKIEEIEKCTKEKLNEREIYYIEYYKSDVKKYGTKYGYNLTSGGQTGKANYKFIDKNLLKNLIEKGLTRKEMAEILGIHEDTVLQKSKEFWGFSLNKLRASQLHNILKILIKKGMSGMEIAKELELNINFIYDKIKQLWGVSLSHVRKTLMNKMEFKIFLEKERIYHGYKKFDEQKLYDLIKNGFTRKQIKDKLNIGINLLYRRLNEFWGLTTLNQARHAFMNKNALKCYYNRIRKIQPKYKELDEDNLIRLIKKGLNAKEIAGKLNLNSKTLRKKIKQLWGLTLNQARKFFIKPYLKYLIIQNFSDKEIANELNISINTLYRWLNEFWESSLIEARRKFMNERLKSLIIQHKNANQIAEEFNISVSTVHNRIEELWGISLTKAWKRFIKPILKDLIIKHLNSADIASILNIDQSTVFHLTKSFWGKTLNESWKQFIKLLLKNFIIINCSANEISENLNIDLSTVYKLTREFWGIKFSKASAYFNSRR